MTESQSSSDMLTSIRSRRIPALLTSTCRSPNAATAASTRFWAPSAEATSSPLAMASPPKDRISSTTCSAARPVVARAVDGPAEVVHDHLGALGGEQQCVLTAQAAPRTRDDRHPPFERTHVVLLLGFSGHSPGSIAPSASPGQSPGQSPGRPVKAASVDGRRRRQR